MSETPTFTIGIDPADIRQMRDGKPIQRTALVERYGEDAVANATKHGFIDAFLSASREGRPKLCRADATARAVAYIVSELGECSTPEVVDAIRGIGLEADAPKVMGLLAVACDCLYIKKRRAGTGTRHQPGRLLWRSP